MMNQENNFPIHVLVVDDDVFISDLLFRFLGKEGYIVHLAENGDKALALLENQHINIALIDLMLEGMDGITLINQINEGDLDLIMIMMTGHPTLETALEAMKMGVQDYLIKPFKLEQLAEVIRRCLKDKSNIQKIHQLQSELEEARGQIQKYENLMKHGHRVLPGSDRHDDLGLPKGLSAYKQKAMDIEERQVRLEKMHEDGIISEEEYQRRWNRLQEMKAKGY